MHQASSHDHMLSLRSQHSCWSSLDDVRAPSERYLVYLATSPSGKFYVGITKRSLLDRQREHRYAARTGRELHFSSALRKYDSAMTWEILEILPSLQEAAERERHYVALYRSDQRAHGYNLTRGGEGVRASADTRAKMSRSAKLRGMSEVQLANLERGRGAAWEGRTHSAVSRAKMSSAHRGHLASETTRAKLSELRRGKKFSAEHKQRLREGNASPVSCSDGRVFSSAADAARSLGLSSDAIAKSIRRGSPCRGLAFVRIPLDEFRARRDQEGN